MALTPGILLGPYEILSALGAGGMGEVYKARDSRLTRTVAIKVLPAHAAADVAARARFEREARAIASLSHPHICVVHDVGSQGDIDYLVMELLEGDTLAERLANTKGPLPLDQVLSIGLAITDALDKAHRAGIVHRDLKPANVMLTKSGPKLLDFGLAKLHRAASPVSLSSVTDVATAGPDTCEGTILGTIHYMAPEQVEGREADSRTDIWAFGTVLYEMATGQRPFDGESAASIIGAILKDAPPALSARQPLTPPMLERIVQKCLAKDPEDRWQNARDLHTALEWSTETGVLGPPTTPRVKWGAGAMLAMIAAFAVGGGIVWTSREPIDRPRRVSLSIAPPPGAEFVVSATGGGAALSPDGRIVTFVARKDGVTSLWLRSLDEDEARQLADTDDAAQPFWSPDSRSIGYFAGGNLRRIDIAGGASRSVTAATGLPRGGAWLADGTIVFSPGIGPLRAVAASGGASKPFTVPREGEPSHRWPHVLPDGRTLLYFIQGRQPGVYLVTDGNAAAPRRIEDATLDAAYASPLRGLPGVLLTVANDRLVAHAFDPASAEPPGSPVAIPGVGDVRTFAGTNRSNLSVANDGTILYVSGSGRSQLAWFRGDGSLISKAAIAPDRYVSIQLSPAGDRVLAVVEAGAGVRDAWVLDLADGTRSRITSENHAGYATWSQDGQHVAIAAPGLQQMIEKAPILGAAERTILAGEDLFPGSWSSRDGHIVYVARRPATGYDIWAVAADGSGKPSPLAQSAAAEMHPQMSPDGRMLAFTSDESGRREVYVRDYPDGQLVQRVSTSGGSYPRWGPRSDEVFYRSQDGRLVVVPLKYSEHAMTVGEPRSLMPLIEPPGELIHPYDIASDGRILALTPLDGASTSVSLGVLLNWRP